MTLGHLIQSTKATLASTNITNLDVELLLTNVLDCQRVFLYTHRDYPLKQKQIEKFNGIFNLRKSGVPMAYILNKQEFYGKEFVVKPGVFIPRSDTETLVSAVIEQQKNKQEALNIIDFGCGSGCIGLSLLDYFPKAHLFSIDLNKKALEISKINAKNYHLDSRVIFFHQDVSHLDKKMIQYFTNKKIDIIVANPPYIAFTDTRVQKEVISFEPAEALFSKKEGFYHISAWFNQASRLLKNGGHYFFEIGAEQNISSLNSQTNNMHKKKEYKDLSGIVRVIEFQKHYG